MLINHSDAEDGEVNTHRHRQTLIERTDTLLKMTRENESNWIEKKTQVWWETMMIVIFFLFLNAFDVDWHVTFLYFNTIIIEYQWTRQIFIDICFSNRYNDEWSNSWCRWCWWWRRKRRLFACSFDKHPMRDLVHAFARCPVLIYYSIS